MKFLSTSDSLSVDIFDKQEINSSLGKLFRSVLEDYKYKCT